ncbi:MAG: hypothetical protein M3O28_07545 [Actinomycetota bacterium]|nr:hypothetical protein [Actinomycetota bacterium]
MSTDELRYAYEQAMTAATRSGDLIRAQKVAGAYEALSAQRRQKVFGRSFDGLGSRATSLPPPRPADRASRPRPRPKKWGMSLPIRVLLFAVVVPLVIVAVFGAILHPQQPSGAGRQAKPGDVRTNSLLSVDATAAALYVERINGRADVTCTLSGTSAGLGQFACQASGNSPTNLAAVVTSPSVYLQSARFDAEATVSAISNCVKFGGRLPDSSGPQSVQAHLTCGSGVLTIYLGPGDSLEYTRTGSATYRLAVVAGNGETVTYDSKTDRNK